MKRILLLLCAVFCMPAMEKQAESVEQGPSLLLDLPIELRQAILGIMAQSKSDGILNIRALGESITNLARLNKQLHDEINTPENMIAILKSLPTRVLAIYLANRLANMPGIRSQKVQEWLKNIKLEDGLKLYEAVNAEKPDIEAIKKLLSNPKIDVNWKNKYGDTALMRASRRGYFEIVKILIAAGANVNKQDGNGFTALMWASVRGYIEVVKLLLEKGANPTIRNNYGITAYNIALDNGNEDIAILIDEALKKKTGK